jgi:protocatechuate 3,4-dioxygenase beta subunit
MTEGPYFKAGSPERASLLEASTAGERLVVSGYVLSTACEPIARVKLDFWQTDGNGIYDNSGYGLRGHQFTDSAGRYELTTVIPGIYPGRTAHIHVKVQAPGGKPLTTQLFFPGQPNDFDRIFDERLLIDLRPAAEGWIGQFDFVLASG